MVYLPIVRSLLTLAILWIGLPRARRFRQPHRFTLGLIMVAIGLMSLWILQVVVATRVADLQLRSILHIVAFVVALSAFGGGLKTISQANNIARDDFYDDLLP